MSFNIHLDSFRGKDPNCNSMTSLIIAGQLTSPLSENESDSWLSLDTSSNSGCDDSGYGVECLDDIRSRTPDFI